MTGTKLSTEQSEHTAGYSDGPGAWKTLLDGGEVGGSPGRGRAGRHTEKLLSTSWHRRILILMTYMAVWCKLTERKP